MLIFYQMVTIIFEAHGTTIDNEAHRASGHNDVELSKKGEEEARDLGGRYKNLDFDAVFCSDLQRSFRTAEIAFQGRGVNIIRDPRLRECDYGDMTRHASEEIEEEKPRRIEEPFPNGESYTETNQRMKEFLKSLRQLYDGKKVLIIGHRATQYGLESLILGKSLTDLVKEKFVWQPGWQYELDKI